MYQCGELLCYITVTVLTSKHTRCISGVQQASALPGRTDSHDGGLDVGVPAHAQVVVAAPDGDVLARRHLARQREVGALAVDALEHAVRVVLLLRVDLLPEVVFVAERRRRR